jgi:predicted esterase YcpF (UPF0227 family)
MLQAEARLLFYFNGFNSGIPNDLADSPKIAEVAAFARRAGFRFLPVSVDYRRAETICTDILGRLGDDVRRVVFWGSSMGGWFARILQIRAAAVHPGLDIEAAAWNPAFDLAAHAHLLIGPQENYVTLEHYEWTAEDSAGLIRLEGSVDYRAPLPYTVYVDRDDEVIDAELSRRYHAGWTRFVKYAGGSHSFEHYREAVSDFEKACGLCASQ